MMIFKKAMPRRTFLRGLGTALALPLLDGMVPAFARAADTAAKPAGRLSIVYLPNGIMMDKWTPATEGAGFQMTPILEPLAPFRDRLLVLSGLAHNSGRALQGENTGDHARAGATYLSGVHPRKTEGADTQAGISMDQIVAKELGKHTQLASLELCLDTPELLGQCEAGYTCAYMNTICWRTPTTPMPMEDRPRAVFERLFGDSDSTDPAVRLRRIKRDRSILDSVTAKAARLRGSLGPSDQAKLTEYLDAIRDVERRIQTAEEQSSRELPTLERPAGVPATFTEHAKLMFDLQVLAYQCDLTRVITFMLGREFGGRTYREIGIPDGHHSLTHHQYKQDKIDKVIQINIYHAKHFAYFLEKLRSTPDGDGSLLDHMVILYGGSLSDGNSHLHDNLPILLVGGGAGQIKGGRHIRYPKDTPMPNLLLTMLDMFRVPMESLGDSTGKLDLLSV
ncbi:MAG: hypothetical protein A3J28_04490 [Acidobacteria bacterium RIFCSPLOWO2_12_FULL_60_22]|nr:MAG: hypothetical protein A3J28_04490 [Acidobacteria bacterium RIFCSPLOWO2_12_FULL_60_22]